MADEHSHVWMPKVVEPEEIHLMNHLLDGPFLNGYAVDGDENAGAIFTEPAMNEDSLLGIPGK